MTQSESRLDPRQSLVRRTLWRIETELARAPSLADLAAAEDVSRFHLTRAFALATGLPVMAYVRARRLTEAAHRLRTGDDTVLSIALDTGYDSHEGFARAFRDMFGVAPSAVRAEPGRHLRTQEPLHMTTETVAAPVPRFVDCPARKIVGTSERYNTESRARIPAQWERTLAEFADAMHGAETFGVCHDFDGTAFCYLIGVSADMGGDEPWPAHIDLPKSRYAVFDHSGHISGIPETWQAIFEDWAPQAGTEITEAPQFEQYGADFDPEKPGGVSIWIPVRSG